MKKIILTGGGSAGHVTPNLALIPELQNLGWNIQYIGTHSGIEREIIGDLVPYHPISAGKLRRYFDWQNFSDPFRVIRGTYDAFKILRKERPKIIFSKGGFVSLPVVMAAKILKIPVILHESDFTPGLANKLSLPFATHLCLTFPETKKLVKHENVTVTGNPIRKQLLAGNPELGFRLCNFSTNKPVVLVIGGSLGAQKINGVVRECLPQLLKDFQVVHICGKGNLDSSVNRQGYQQFEYVKNELPDLFAMADLIVSRAGANALFELLALKKPHILIPLSQAASRGDQILNADSFLTQGFSLVIHEEQLSPEQLIGLLQQLNSNQSQYIKAMEKAPFTDATAAVVDLIEKLS